MRYSSVLSVCMGRKGGHATQKRIYKMGQKKSKVDSQEMNEAVTITQW